MDDRKILTASEGKVLTDGKAYGKTVYLSIGANESEWYEITEAEYEEIVDSEQADETDYIAALERLGVK